MGKPNPTEELLHLYVYLRLLERRLDDKLGAGDVEGALTEFITMIRMLDHQYAITSYDAARQAATWDSELYRIAQPLLAAAQSRPETLRKLLKALEGRRPLPSMQSVARSEYAEWLCLFRAIEDYSYLNTTLAGEKPKGPALIDRLVATRFGKRIVERSLASTFRRFWQSAPTDPARYRDFEKAIESRSLAIKRAKGKTLSGYAIAKLIGEGIAAYQYQGALTSRRLVSLTVRALLARSTGIDPRTIVAKAGVNGIDEYSGMPFGFKVDEEHLLIYAFGSDKVDDLGRIKRDSLNRTTDIPIVIRLKPIPKLKASSSKPQ